MYPNFKNIIFNFSVVMISAAIIHGTHGQDYENAIEFGNNPFSGEGTMYCFQCNSRLDGDCAYIQPNDTSSYHYKPCLDTDKYNGSQPFCRKIVQKIKVRDHMEIVIRKCGWVRHPRLDCYNNRNDDHEETICQCFDIGCNNSPSFHHLGATTTLIGLLVYLIVGGQ